MPVIDLIETMDKNVTISDPAQPDSDSSTNYKIVSDEVMFYFGLINWSAILSVFMILGIVGNIANLVVFYKIGFKETINLSLFGLGIADLGSCIAHIWMVIGCNPYFRDLDLPIESVEVAYVIGAWPHIGFTKITTLITAFITIERCLCVASPLKVKSYFTRDRVLGFLIFCYVFVTFLIIPIFYTNQLGWKFNPQLNRTRIGLVFAKEREAVETVIFPILNAFLSMFAFIVIIIATIILVVNLKKKSKWRQTATSSNVNNSNKDFTSKDQKISKMVVLISTLFIVCFIPTVAKQMTMWSDRRVSIIGQFANFTSVFASFTFIMEAINSSLNVFIYFKNSSNYRAMFKETFYFKSSNPK